MIDWEKRAVRIAGRFTKTGKPIYVPLNPVAMAILKRRYEAVDKDGKSTPATPPTSSRGAAGSSPRWSTKAFRQARAKAAWRTFASTP